MLSLLRVLVSSWDVRVLLRAFLGLGTNQPLGIVTALAAASSAGTVGRYSDCADWRDLTLVPQLTLIRVWCVRVLRVLRPLPSSLGTFLRLSRLGCSGFVDPAYRKLLVRASI